MLKSGAGVDQVDRMKWTPMSMAVYTGRMDILKLLFENGANLNIQTDGCFSPLNRAINEDKVEMATFVIENGADVNMVDGKKWTPIAKAIQKRNMEHSEKHGTKQNGPKSREFTNFLVLAL